MPVRGSKAVSAALRRAGPLVRQYVGDALEDAGEGVLQDMRLLAPRDTGVMAASLTMLRSDIETDWLRVAIGLPTDRLANDYFYARFVEFGTKGGEVTARSKTGRRYKMRVPARPARPFMGPAVTMNRDDLDRDVRTAIAAALRAARGSK